MEEEFSVKREDYATWLTRTWGANTEVWTFFHDIKDMSEKDANSLGVSLKTVEEWFVDHTMVVAQGG